MFNESKPNHTSGHEENPSLPVDAVLLPVDELSDLSVADLTPLADDGIDVWPEVESQVGEYIRARFDEKRRQIREELAPKFAHEMQRVKNMSMKDVGEKELDAYKYAIYKKRNPGSASQDLSVGLDEVDGILSKIRSDKATDEEVERFLAHHAGGPREMQAKIFAGIAEKEERDTFISSYEKQEEQRRESRITAAMALEIDDGDIPEILQFARTKAHNKFAAALRERVEKLEGHIHAREPWSEIKNPFYEMLRKQGIGHELPDEFFRIANKMLNEARAVSEDQQKHAQFIIAQYIDWWAERAEMMEFEKEWFFYDPPVASMSASDWSLLSSGLPDPAPLPAELTSHIGYLATQREPYEAWRREQVLHALQKSRERWADRKRKGLPDGKFPRIHFAQATERRSYAYQEGEWSIERIVGEKEKLSGILDEQVQYMTAGFEFFYSFIGSLSVSEKRGFIGEEEWAEMRQAAENIEEASTLLQRNYPRCQEFIRSLQSLDQTTMNHDDAIRINEVISTIKGVIDEGKNQLGQWDFSAYLKARTILQGTAPEMEVIASVHKEAVALFDEYSNLFSWRIDQYAILQRELPAREKRQVGSLSGGSESGMNQRLEGRQAMVEMDDNSLANGIRDAKGKILGSIAGFINRLRRIEGLLTNITDNQSSQFDLREDFDVIKEKVRSLRGGMAQMRDIIDLIDTFSDDRRNEAFENIRNDFILPYKSLMVFFTDVQKIEINQWYREDDEGRNKSCDDVRDILSEISRIFAEFDSVVKRMQAAIPEAPSSVPEETPVPNTMQETASVLDANPTAAIPEAPSSVPEETPVPNTTQETAPVLDASHENDSSRSPGYSSGQDVENPENNVNSPPGSFKRLMIWGAGVLTGVGALVAAIFGLRGGNKVEQGNAELAVADLPVLEAPEIDPPKAPFEVPAGQGSNSRVAMRPDASLSAGGQIRPAPSQSSSVSRAKKSRVPQQIVVRNEKLTNAQEDLSLTPSASWSASGGEKSPESLVVSAEMPEARKVDLSAVQSKSQPPSLNVAAEEDQRDATSSMLEGQGMDASEVVSNARTISIERTSLEIPKGKTPWQAVREDIVNNSSIEKVTRLKTAAILSIALKDAGITEREAMRDARKKGISFDMTHARQAMADLEHGLTPKEVAEKYGSLEIYKKLR